jgi:hypothetical protein
LNLLLLALTQQFPLPFILLDQVALFILVSFVEVLDLELVLLGYYLLKLLNFSLDLRLALLCQLHFGLVDLSPVLLSGQLVRGLHIGPLLVDAGGHLVDALLHLVELEGLLLELVVLLL